MVELNNLVPRATESVEHLLDGLLRGERRSLARAITLIESKRMDHRQQAVQLLLGLAQSPPRSPTIRIGISGTPGVGKSTFIEALGMFLIGLGKKVAVLAVDPSSTRSGGSILGDKTRMENLSREANAFIRPSPSGGTLGGVARRSRETLQLVEAAGFDVVIVETVGVGQSEVAVSDMVDMFLLLLAPAGGDELQGIKRGIMEIADLVVINKADGQLEPIAQRAMSEHRMALQLMRPRDPRWKTRVVLASALHNKGIGDVWSVVEDYYRDVSIDGIQARRSEQLGKSLWNDLSDGLMDRFMREPGRAAQLAQAEMNVRLGKIPPTLAAENLLDLFHK